MGRITMLPHGAVSVAGVEDATVREALRKLTENQQALAKEVEALKKRGGK